MTETVPAYVEPTPTGGWRVAGTRVSLDSVVHAYWQGRLPEAIVADFPSLTLEQVHGAIAFYLGHRNEIDAYLSQRQSEAAEIQRDIEKKFNPVGIRARLLARQHAKSAG